MALYRRGDKWWFEFWFDGERIRQSTGLTNKNDARVAEAAERTRLRRERDGRRVRAEQLQCQPDQLVRCPECERWFNGEAAVLGQGKMFCSAECCDRWWKRQSPVPTLADFIEQRFEPWAKATFQKSSPATWHRWYRTNLSTIKAYAPLAGLRLDRVTTENVAEFIAHRQSENLAVSTVNRSLQVLRAVLRKAVEWGVIATAPKVELLRGERHRERVITPVEEVRYLAAAPEPLCSIATLLVDSGLRPEECFRLRWESITWVNGRYGSLLVTHGKTAAARRVLPMTPRVRHVLEAHWTESGVPEEGWMWSAPTRSGHVEPSSLRKQHARTFKTIAEQSAMSNEKPVRPFVLYSLRHTFLTRLGESGCNVWTLARIAGHSSIAMSACYVHPSEDSVLNAMANLETRREVEAQPTRPALPA